MYVCLSTASLGGKALVAALKNNTSLVTFKYESNTWSKITERNIDKSVKARESRYRFPRLSPPSSFFPLPSSFWYFVPFLVSHFIFYISIYFEYDNDNI